MYYIEKLNQSDVKLFESVFKCALAKFVYIPMAIVKREFLFDPMKFDDYLKAHFGYSEEKHGSIRDFIEKTEPRLVKIIEGWMGGGRGE